MTSLTDQLTTFRAATYWAATGKLGKGFGVAYPDDATKVAAYVAALDRGDYASPVPAVATKHAQGLVGMLSVLASRLAAEPAPAPGPTPTPVPPTGAMPKQGISIPLGTLGGDADFILDRCRDVAGGHPFFVRTDWWPGNATFATVQAKAEARGLTMLPILNYDPSNRPSVSAYAAQAVQLAALFPIVNLLNEPNLGGWTATDAAAYTKPAYDAIGGKALVLGPSVGFNKGGGWPPSAVLAWVQAYHDAGGRQDVGAATCYGDAEDIDPAWNGWAVVPQIRTLLGGRMAILEGGWRGGPAQMTPYNRPAMSQDAYQEIVVRTGLNAVAAGRVESFMVFSMPNNTADYGYGLLDDTKQPRPAYATLKALAA